MPSIHPATVQAHLTKAPCPETTSQENMTSVDARKTTINSINPPIAVQQQGSMHTRRRIPKVSSISRRNGGRPYFTDFEGRRGVKRKNTNRKRASASQLKKAVPGFLPLLLGSPGSNKRESPPVTRQTHCARYPREQG